MKKKGKVKVASQTDAECFHYGRTGHWKRNCKDYLESAKKKHNDASTLSIYVIKINTSITNDNRIWVLDTRCGSHLVSSMQGLTSSRKVNKYDVDLRLANGANVAALAVGTYNLYLPSDQILV